MIYTILIIVQVIVALSLIVLILLQHGKGADAGAAFGSGASGTVFGAKGSANFMSHATAGLATMFMVISLVLAYLINGAGGAGGTSVTDKLTHGTQGAPSSVISTQTGDQKTSHQSEAKPKSDNQAPSGSNEETGSKNKGGGLKIPD